jgi:NAD+ kinase
VIAKRSAFTRNVEEAEDPRIMGLLKRGDPAVSSWVPSHQEHKRTLEATIRTLEDLGAHVLLLRRPHAAFDAGDAALVVTVGGDGTLLAASHYVGRVPILGINSDPNRSVGFFCAGSRETLPKLAARALEGTLTRIRLNRMKVTVNGRIKSKRVLNDVLFCHTSPAATSRYILRHGRTKEEQRSSGLWVGPAAGSTAAQRSAGGRILPISSNQIQYVVREPYTAPGGECRLPKGLLEPRRKLVVKSKMSDARMFLDGPHRKFTVRLGDEVVFESPGEPLTVLGIRGRRRASSKRA